MVKKIFPLIVLVSVFSGFLASQIIFDLFNTEARLTTKEKSTHAFYATQFSKTVLKSVEKELWDLKEVKSPIIILNFWASWCQPCLEEFPSLVKLRNTFTEDKVKILTINIDGEDQKEKIKKIQSKYSLNFPIIADRDDQLVNQFKISELPITIVFHKGQVIEVSKGAKDFVDSKFISKLTTHL